MEENQTQLLDTSYSIDVDEEEEENTFSRECYYKKPRSLTLAEKIKVIRMSEMISNPQYLSQKFGCSRTQIQNILNNRQEYLNEWRNYGNPCGVRRKRSIALLTLGTIVNEWIQRCRRNGIAITDDDIRQTGQIVANIIKMTEFRPHNKWLDRLKCKYKLSNLDLQQLNPTISSGSNKTKESIKVEDIIAHFRERKSENISIYKYLNEKVPSSSFKKPNSESEDSEDGIPLQLNAERSRHPATYESKSKKKISTFITSYKEALNHLGPLEHFALMEEDIRAIGLINQLENLFREKMQLKEGENNCDKKK